ncbi:Uncharacterized protein APZ42_016379 [Daphnia magna]|uniref:Uncharacterized protein n=1 Tax=Daphnia magna TaxID=35525 RepID=A0A165AE02_9CRUS|nr:Uncharacterized protein APZ42_016379 [Daphnia magna]
MSRRTPIRHYFPLGFKVTTVTVCVGNGHPDRRIICHWWTLTSADRNLLFEPKFHAENKFVLLG